MARLARLWSIGLVLSLTAWAQQPAPAPPEEAAPAEEDVAYAPKEYGFNPLQGQKERQVGDYYMKRGSHKAAATRYEEATRWNPADAEAWRKLGEAREQLKDAKGAQEAYAKYLEVAPTAKDAAAVKKRMARAGRA